MINLTEEQKKAIASYGENIVSFKDDIEAIQRLPGVFISHLNDMGELTLIREIFQNATDQLSDPNSPCDKVQLFYNEKTLETTVIDNGMGIPFDDMIRIYTKSYTSGNYIKKKGVYKSSTHGIGSKAANALSETFIVESYRYDGEARRIEMHEGRTDKKEPEKIPNPNKFQGTKVYFVPSAILGDINLKWNTVYNMMRNIIALTPIGSKVEFEAIDKAGNIHKETIVNNDGMMYFIIKNTKSPIISPVRVIEDTGEMMLDCLITWDAAALSDPSIDMSYVSYCNYSQQTAQDSKNITGTIKGITSWFCDYMNKIYLVNSRAKTRVVPNDVKTGLSIVINSGVLEPIFGGQAKETLTNEEMDPFCKDVIVRGLDEWSKNNPNDLQKVAKFIHSIAQIREKADKEKVKISANYESSAFSGLPSKYTKPTGKDHLELFICEGDSAKSPIIKCRDTSTQGVYPIRGKIISAFSHSAKEVFNNAEKQGILNILFGKKVYTPANVKELTIDDCKFEKVVFTTDADIDP